jgi:hypothetical protein
MLSLVGGGRFADVGLILGEVALFVATGVALIARRGLDDLSFGHFGLLWPENAFGRRPFHRGGKPAQLDHARGELDRRFQASSDRLSEKR